MSARTPDIGFSSQRLRYEWVRHAALLGLAGMAGDTMAAELDSYLGETLSSASGGRGSREKAITILKRIWAPDTNQLRSLRSEGFSLLQGLPDAQHLAVHWGMTMATYPYWSSTAKCVGRLLRLQMSANSAQIRRRMQETYGDREIVARATRNIVRSYIDWGVLLETTTRGIYIAAPTLTLNDSTLIAWLIEASLYARANSSGPWKDLIDSPSLFPFRIKPVSVETVVSVSSRLVLFHHGMDDDLVALRKHFGAETGS